MGESHPAENKVVVEFSPVDLGLTDAQQLKLKKLLGVRLNPETNIAKMSCEQFDHQAQNKRYLGDLVQKLVAEAKVRYAEEAQEHVSRSMMLMSIFLRTGPYRYVRGCSLRYATPQVQGQAQIPEGVAAVGGPDEVPH
jgi:hypothetical protein